MSRNIGLLPSLSSEISLTLIRLWDGIDRQLINTGTSCQSYSNALLPIWRNDCQRQHAEMLGASKPQPLIHLNRSCEISAARENDTDPKAQPPGPSGGDENRQLNIVR